MKGYCILAGVKREDETGLPEMRDAIPDAGEIIYLSPEDQRRVAEAILNPPEPVEALILLCLEEGETMQFDS